MSAHKISANDIALQISTDGGVTYPYLVCLTSFNFSRQTNIIDAASFCGPDTLPGAQTNTLTFEGQIMEDPVSGQISTDDLTDLQMTKQTINWKLGKLVPLIGDETEFGTAFVSEITKTGSVDTVVTFSGALGIYGQASHTTATS